jgi:hypothetical protein
MVDLVEFDEEIEMEIFEELYYFVNNIRKKKERKLTMEMIKIKAEHAFTRNNVSTIFLDEDFLNDFLKKYKLNIRKINMSMMKERQRTGKTKTDLLEFFAQKLTESLKIDIYEVKFNFWSSNIIPVRTHKLFFCFGQHLYRLTKVGDDNLHFFFDELFPELFAFFIFF